MLKSELLKHIQQVIRLHSFDQFIDEPPSVAQGGRGVVVPGCSACRKRLHTVTQFVEHLTEDAMPRLIEWLSTEHSDG